MPDAAPGVELSPLRHDAALAAFRALPDVRPELVRAALQEPKLDRLHAARPPRPAAAPLKLRLCPLQARVGARRLADWHRLRAMLPVACRVCV